MNGEVPALFTSIVSPEDAWGFVRAGMTRGDVRVEVVAPRTREERVALVAEHLSTVLRQPQAEIVADSDYVDFSDSLIAAFDGPEPAVMVRMRAAPGRELTQFDIRDLEVLAEQHRAVNDYMPYGPL